MMKMYHSGIDNGFPIDTQIQLNNGTEIQIKNGVTSFSGVPL